MARSSETNHPSRPLLIRNMPPLDKVRTARLPEAYREAKLAISECAKVDECQQWADRAEALASYARQANDEELRRMADRIQARAIRRCGDLLREIEKSSGGRPPKTQDGTVPRLTRTQAARDVGLSERQRKTAIRVSNVPGEVFEAAVDSDDPPTVTALAERGKQTRPKPLVDLGDITPAQYYEASKLIGMLDSFRRESGSLDMERALSGIKEHEWAELAVSAAACMTWLKALMVTIEENKKCIQAAI